VQPFSRRDGVEIAGDDVKAVLMMADPLEKGAELGGAPTFGPLGEPGAEMERENAKLSSGENDLEKGMASSRRSWVSPTFDRPGMSSV